jgi:spore coat polysaccharide biosynthesis protein SpsF
MQSTRLPGKVLRSFSDGATLLEKLVDGLSFSPIPLFVATSNSYADNEIATWCQKRSVKCYRGPEIDVLQRFLDLARNEQLQSVIRVCADNPFFQFDSLDYFLELAVQNPNCDYISYRDVNLTPSIQTHWGLYGEWVSVSALEKVNQLTLNKHFREHVTNFIYSNPDRFEICLVEAPEIILERKDLRFTIDDYEDFRNMDKLIGLVGINANMRSLIETVDQNFDIKLAMQKAINQYTK